jgi:hypothetical protein
MQRSPITGKKYPMMIWSAFLICWAALIWRWMTPHMGMQARGPLIWIEILLLLILYGYILLSAYGLGHLFLRLFKLPLLSKTESILLAFMIGLAAFSLGVTIIGLAGWLNIVGILAWMAISGSVALRELLGVAHEREVIDDAPHSAPPRSRFEIFLQIIILIAIPLQLVSAISPVWDYDALLYHLEIPSQFLAEGRIYFDPETWRSAYPFLGEMPFVVGMAFGLDPLGKLINLTYAVLFVSSVYLFSLRFLGRQTASSVAAILIGAPAFLLWATWAAVDFAWASYEFWSIFAICLWLTGDHRMPRKWLILAGLMSGAAASIKYLSLPIFLIVGAIVVWKSIANTQQRVRGAVSNLLIFGVCAGLVMGVWYIKNWLLTGNPVYPLVFGGPGWDPLENQVLNDYVQTFGAEKTWLDYLLLPYNVYAQHARFGTIPIEVIHPALWLGFFFPFVTKSNKVFKVVLVYAALSFLLWVTTSQVIRFLIPLSAFAAILSASVIERSPSLLKNLLRYGLLGGIMILSLIQQMLTIQNTGVWNYVSGQKPGSQFLQELNNDFSTILYIQSALAPTDRVMFLWDGRGYYCDKRCVPDDEQSTAIRLSIDSPAPQNLARDLNEQGITHLMLSVPDASWFIFYHDPRGWHQDAFDYFDDIFLPACGKLTFEDKDIKLFELICH